MFPDAGNEPAYRLFEVARTWVRLACVDIKLCILPPRKKKEWLYGNMPETLPPLDPAQRREALRLEKLVASASARPLFFNMSCLRRALVTRALLEEREIPSNLIFGIRKSPKAHTHEVHAWLELGDFRLGFGIPQRDPGFIPFRKKIDSK